ncbi:MAG: DinB family protein, partial [Nitrospiria bacterium]
VAPGFISGWPLNDTFEFSGDPTPLPTSTAEILAVHDKGIGMVKENLTKLGDEGLKNMWTATSRGKTLMKMPKAALVRSILMNHIYHHRGQLTVYLRMLDIPVPAVYGPSADENPFG